MEKLLNVENDWDAEVDYAYAYVCSATSNWQPGHHGVTTIYNLHHPGCCLILAGRKDPPRFLGIYQVES